VAGAQARSVALDLDGAPVVRGVRRGRGTRPVPRELCGVHDPVDLAAAVERVAFRVHVDVVLVDNLDFHVGGAPRALDALRAQAHAHGESTRIILRRLAQHVPHERS
jgi:hypothetical protein